jgi:hypothetical protein
MTAVFVLALLMVVAVLVGLVGAMDGSEEVAMIGYGCAAVMCVFAIVVLVGCAIFA